MKQIFVEGIISLLVSTVAIMASVNSLSGHTTQQAFDLAPFQETLNTEAQQLDQTTQVGDRQVGDQHHTQSDRYAS